MSLQERLGRPTLCVQSEDEQGKSESRWPWSRSLKLTHLSRDAEGWSGGDLVVTPASRKQRPTSFSPHPT